MRLLLVTPVLDEAAHIERTIRSVAAQSRVPDRWLIVDDGSRDGTLELARSACAGLPWAEVIEAPAGGPRGGLERASELRAFKAALALAGWRDYTHVGKLDGDVELPARYFERLLERFEADPTLGIAGGNLFERHGERWRTVPVPSHHVHGALRVYSGDCLEAIGELVERLGWDTIDLTYARMHGFGTRSFGDLAARHHRPWGSSGGRLRGCARYGECAWTAAYPAAWVAARSLKVALTRPFGLSGLAFAFGWLRAARAVPRVQDEEFRAFVRRELWARVQRHQESPFAIRSAGR